MDIEFYDFKENLGSVEWIYSLPNGTLSEKIDTRYRTVYITKLEDGYKVYVGPKDLDLQGEAIIVTLDNELKLKDYEIEKIEPIPKFESES